MFKAQWLCSLGLVVLAGCAGAKSDQQSIQDVWTIVTAEEGGQPPEDSRKRSTALIDGELGMFTLYSDEAPTRLTFKFKLDPTKTPKQIDLDWDGLVQQGIYELNGDDLKICYDQEGKTRPTAFQSQAGDKMLNLVLKRNKG